MERNVGGIDRSVRLVIGPILAIVGVAMVLELLPFGPLTGGLLVAMGAILLVTGAVQRCPIHELLGVNTCPVE